MKHWAGVIVVLLLVQGCQPGFQASNLGPGQAHIVYQSVEVGTNTGDWLLKRHSLCQLPITEQRVRLNTLTTNKETSSKSEKIERLLITTCKPDWTPGLLRQALNDLMAENSWADEELYLLQLIKDLDTSNRLLEDKNRQLKEDLESTIKGIRDIESDMDNLDQNGGAP